MADSSELVLLDVNISPFAGRVRVALAEKGLKYESKQEDLTNKSSLFLEMNPIHQMVPVLIHNGKPICESLIIVEYIDEVWNHKSPLLPSDPYERAQARFWADFIDNKIVARVRIIAVIGMEKEQIEAAKKDLVESLKLLEVELGDKPYYGGENLGFLDIALITFYPSFYSFEKFGNLLMEDEVPNLVAWAKRCMEKETVSKSIADPHESYEYFLGLRKKLGTELRI